MPWPTTILYIIVLCRLQASEQSIGQFYLVKNECNQWLFCERRITLILLAGLSFHSLTRNSNLSFREYANFDQEENNQEILDKILATIIIAFVEIRNRETSLS